MSFIIESHRDWINAIFDVAPNKKRAVSKEEALLIMGKICDLRHMFLTEHSEVLEKIGSSPWLPFPF